MLLYNIKCVQYKDDVPTDFIVTLDSYDDEYDYVSKFLEKQIKSDVQILENMDDKYIKDIIFSDIQDSIEPIFESLIEIGLHPLDYCIVVEYTENFFNKIRSNIKID